MEEEEEGNDCEEDPFADFDELEAFIVGWLRGFIVTKLTKAPNFGSR